jgi:glucose/arabinose dehydrogenase
VEQNPLLLEGLMGRSNIEHVISILALLTLPLLSFSVIGDIYAQVPAFLPSVKDPDFVVEEFVPHLSQPTSIAFVDEDSDNLTLFVLQKNDGTVRVARNGVLLERPALDVNVANEGEQGMLGIATVGNNVYLYFTESSRDGGEAISKRVYRYTWNGEELVDPVLVKDLPATWTFHNGGAMAVGPDGTVYLVVGDSGRYGILQNKAGGEFYPDTSVIMPVSPEGDYYAIGVRNSFGMAFDPVTGRLWITENGDDSFDEINLVEPGFNSGWEVTMGPATEGQLSNMVEYGHYVYSDPEFSWQRPVAPAGLAFASGSLSKYSGSLFVGDCNLGNIYRFTLNEERDGFVFSDTGLSDKVAHSDDSTSEIIFGERFGCVTDLDVGPDGLLYITSYSPFTTSAIFRLVPKDMSGAGPLGVADESALYAAVAIAGAGVTGAAIVLKRRASKRKVSQA